MERDGLRPDVPKREDMEFVSEAITPGRGSFDPAMMSRGLAALPRAFTWRDVRYEVVACLEHNKVSTPEGGRAGNEVYLRRQEFVVRLHTGQHAVLYVQRQTGGKRTAQRWFVYAIEPQR